jgi:8-oxo-dGTP diphosphatase
MQKSFSRVLIKDARHHILVIQDRADTWNFPGGKKEIDESPLECAIREVREEIGLLINDLTEIHQGDFNFGGTQWRGHFFFANAVNGVPVINELDKIKEIQYIDSFEKVSFPLEILDIIQQIFESLQVQTMTTNWR